MIRIAIRYVSLASSVSFLVALRSAADSSAYALSEDGTLNEYRSQWGVTSNGIYVPRASVQNNRTLLFHPVNCTLCWLCPLCCADLRVISCVWL